MRLTIHGAAGEVTGSCHLLEVSGRKILVDCGLIQGGPEDEARNREPFPFEPADIDAVVLTHAHIDHSGRLPLLVREGFRGTIYTHRATRDLCRIMLRDSAYLQQKDAELDTRKLQRRGKPPVEPLYTIEDAESAMHRFRGLDYDTEYRIAEGIMVRLHDAGHIIGSAIVELMVGTGTVKRRLVFSGDLGHAGNPILRDPAIMESADLVILEATYGDRDHRGWGETWAEMGEVFKRAASGRGNILIPAFAVGRTQEILYMCRENHREWGLDRWQFFLDSPMAIEATEVYARHWYLHEDGTGSNPFTFPGVRFTQSPEESMAINRIGSGAVIIAGSGMCTGGRIRHHLKHNLWRRQCHVVITGFQARGTLGRRLVDGAEEVSLWGEQIQVAASVHTVGGLSAHAGRSGLLDWYRNFQSRPKVLLVHGETVALESLSAVLAAEGVSVAIAQRGKAYHIA